MYFIPVILGSIRRNRESAKVAQFALDWLKQLDRVRAELLDLKELDLPMMEERLRFRDDAPASVREFSVRIAQADAIVIVSPEYSGGYPGVLKNALDYLKHEYQRKPFGIITVSAVETGGILCLNGLRQVVLHLGGVPIPASLMVARVQEAFDAEGNPTDPKFTVTARKFFDELMWFTEALSARRSAKS
ncbi:MAG TPA: NADPH-dependent FMN reductase [Candidatus Angelobacter sp.]|nr:NADPH-dependent FMN reductase [Candidatus Angelobacter sp.]